MTTTMVTMMVTMMVITIVHHDGRSRTTFPHHFQWRFHPARDGRRSSDSKWSGRVGAFIARCVAEEREGGSRWPIESEKFASDISAPLGPTPKAVLDALTVVDKYLRSLSRGCFGVPGDMLGGKGLEVTVRLPTNGIVATWQICHSLVTHRSPIAHPSLIRRSSIARPSLIQHSPIAHPSLIHRSPNTRPSLMQLAPDAAWTPSRRASSGWRPPGETSSLWRGSE